MPRWLRSRWVKWLGTALVAFLVLWIVVYVATGPGPVPRATVDFAHLTPAQRTALVDRGRYVARAADCAACHASTDGLPYAGGLPIETPFGTLHGTNITPSTAHGIGDWTPDDLYRAMVYGIGRGGKRLYPAMPYTSYHWTSRADVDALFVYLASLRPIEKPNEPMPLLFKVRPVVAFWNALFRPRSPLPDVSGRSAEWRRGRYLVDVLGHCGECHTPRNFAYAKTDRHLQGFTLEGTEAPDITAASLARRGWTRRDLAVFLHDGLSPQGTANFRMASVIEESTQYLSPADLAAMTTYLMGRAPPPAVRVVAQRYDGIERGSAMYIGACAGCHGESGEGQPHSSPPLRSNTSAMLADPRNLILAIEDGFPPRDLPGWERMQAMPGFADRLSDADTAALANYLRAMWGGRRPDVTEADVSRVRRR